MSRSWVRTCVLVTVVLWVYVCGTVCVVCAVSLVELSQTRGPTTANVTDTHTSTIKPVTRAEQKRVSELQRQIAQVASMINRDKVSLCCVLSWFMCCIGLCCV